MGEDAPRLLFALRSPLLLLSSDRGGAATVYIEGSILPVPSALHFGKLPVGSCCRPPCFPGLLDNPSADGQPRRPRLLLDAVLWLLCGLTVAGPIPTLFPLLDARVQIDLLYGCCAGSGWDPRS